MEIRFPYAIEANGRTATAVGDDHIRQMIEQLLFTNPGERVNRPDFGSGLLQLVFMPNSDELAAALQANVHAALQRWLGDLIEIQDLDVVNEDARLHITLKYVVSRTGETRADEFERSVA